MAATSGDGPAGSAPPAAATPDGLAAQPAPSPLAAATSAPASASVVGSASPVWPMSPSLAATGGAASAAAGALATNTVHFVCQRCKNPLRLDPTLADLTPERYASLVGAAAHTAGARVGDRAVP